MLNIRLQLDLPALSRLPRADTGAHHLPADLIALIEGLGLTRPRPPIAAIHRTVVKVCAGTGWRQWPKPGRRSLLLWQTR